jgi:hypothetical protein
MKEKRTEARERGGQNRRRIRCEPFDEYEINTYKDIQKLLGIAINELIRGECTPQKARAIGYLCNLAKNIKSDARWEIYDGF